MSLASSITGIKINSNMIDVGRFSDGTSAANYTYSSMLSLTGSATINANTFQGCIGGSSGSTNLITLGSGSCLIKNNLFIRGAGSPVNTYITCTGSDDHVIRDNIFDQPTTDGSSDTLVSGLSSASLYANNKNQSATVEVPVSSDMMMYSASSNSPTWTGAYGSVNSVFWAESPIVTSTSGPNSDFITIEDSAGTVTRSWIKRFNLSTVVPKGAKVIGAQAGTGAIGGSFLVDSSSFFAIRLTSYKKIATQGTSGSILNVIDNRNNVSNYIQQDAYNSTLMNALTFSTTYVALDTTNYSSSDVSENYRVGGDYNTVLEWKFKYTKIDASTVGYVFSPIVIKYRW